MERYVLLCRLTINTPNPYLVRPYTTDEKPIKNSDKMVLLDKLSAYDSEMLSSVNF